MIEEGQIIEEKKIIKNSLIASTILKCDTDLYDDTPSNKRKRCITPKYCSFCDMNNHSYFDCSVICTNYKCSKFKFHKKCDCKFNDIKFYFTVPAFIKLVRYKKDIDIVEEHADKFFDTRKYYDLIDKYEIIKKCENNYLDEIDFLKKDNKNLDKNIDSLNIRLKILEKQSKNKLLQYNIDICELNECISKMNSFVNELKNKIEEYKMQNNVLEDQLQSRDEELAIFREQCDGIDSKKYDKLEKLKKLLNDIL